MTSSSQIITVGAIVFPLTIVLSTAPAFAGGGSDATSGTSTTTNPIDTATPVQLQQTGVVQFSNWGGSSSLVPPNCSGGCAFAVTRIGPSGYGSSANWEGLLGVTVSFGTNDGGVSELNRVNGEVQKHRSEHEIKLVLSEKLSEALEKGQTERAKIIAMNLAPLLGYKDYRVLLRELAPAQTTNKEQKHSMNNIYTPVMF
jgi:hypothetical protein